tara:strand:- start:3134 stop:3595 length:462 start_codon:yes stop_codon:yes gene_type:complete
MKDIITNELSKALKNGDKERIHTLRLIIATIKDKEIASRSSGEDPEMLEETIIQLLKKMVKQRNDSIEMFEKAGRTELAEKEKLEITIINEFLPKQLSEEETAAICDNAINATEASNLKEIGKVIKYLKDNSSTSLDMSLASKLIKEKLENYQ